MSTHNVFFMENWSKLSQNYYQILLLNKFSEKDNSSTAALIQSIAMKLETDYFA